MEQIRTIPKDILCIIPKFSGEEGLLNLFIKKGQYVYNAFSPTSATPLSQKTYVFHAISSRLCGRAAILLSEREDINSWDSLQEILIQHFGDPRSEECIAIELEQLKIKSGESYIELCHRIQHMRSSLFSKVNLLTDEGVKAAKMIVYNNLALNVFLYNLTEDLIRIVRLKGCPSLETALSIVTEEVNFMQQYNAKNKTRQHSTPQAFKPPQPNPFTGANATPNFKFGTPQLAQRFPIPNPNFKFGPQQPQQGFRFTPQNQPTGYRFNPNQAPQQNFRFGVPRQQSNFGIPQQGYRPPFNNNFTRPPPPPGMAPQHNFKFGIPYARQQAPNPLASTDVSMRTARPLRQNMLTTPSEPADSENLFYDNEIVESLPEQYNDADNYENYTQIETQQYDEACYPEPLENFHVQASSFHPK